MGCVYGPCGGCEYEDCINDDGVCTMYDPELSDEDSVDDEGNCSSDDEGEN